MHKALLCEHSDYFRAAYRSELKEAQQHRFEFADVDREVFRIFVQWMYTSKIYADATADAPMALPWQGDGTDEDDDKEYDDDTPQGGYESELEEEYDEDVGQEPGDADDEMHEHAGGVAMTDEQRVLAQTFSRFYEDSLHLDAYQLGILLNLNLDDPSQITQHEKYRSKWEALLREKRQVQSELFAQLIDLYILADRFGVKALRASLMFHLQALRGQGRDGLGCTLPLHLVTKAFDNLPESSPLCRWLITLFAFDWIPALDDDERAAARAELPKSFLAEAMFLLASRLHGPGSSAHQLPESEPCSYHEHETWMEVLECRRSHGVKYAAWTLTPTDVEPDFYRKLRLEA